jgi:UDP-N-acetylmuramate dehydrogenase
MDMSDVRALEAAEPAGALRRDEPMRQHTSWRAGGPAEQAYFPRDLQDLARFLQRLPAAVPLHVVGLGSNLLVRDGGVQGVVVFTHGALKQVRLLERGDAAPLVYAEAGVASPKVARFACTHGLRGAEFLAGIPGTVGGALAMNAGCYGSETWDIVERVVMLTRRGELLERAPADFEIAYRHVARSLGDGEEELFAAAHLRLTPGDGEDGRRVIRELLQRRIASQPLQQPNAGSVFRNPPGDHAARLIEACGLKGFAIGGAQVSPKHANFIVNVGNASAADIEALIEHARATVFARTGVALEREVRIIGERA